MGNLFKKWGNRILRANLQVKVILFFFVPILITLTITFYLHTIYEWKEWTTMTSITSNQMADITVASLQHALQVNDRSMTAKILANIQGDNLIRGIQVIGLSGKVYESTNPGEIGKLVSIDQPGCVECHSLPIANRPDSVQLGGNPGSLRVSASIPNLLECQGCHPASERLLGVLVVTTSLEEANHHYRQEIASNYLITVTSLVAILGFTLLLVNWLIKRRITLLSETLKTYAAGDHTRRVPKIWHTSDEITELADTFNSMADQLEKQEQNKEERTQVREKAIVEERERIGRELHDGIAQFLGYVTTKSQAARLFLEKNQVIKAQETMRHIEEETHKQAMDVRGSILGLKNLTQPELVFTQDVKDYLVQSNRFMDIQVQFDLDPRVDDYVVEGERRLQLLRILQEAISNIRKHSQARQAWVTLKIVPDDMLELTIRDDGVGFDWNEGMQPGQHFGLATMQERARSIQADFVVSTGYNQGTVVQVHLPLEEKPK